MTTLSLDHISPEEIAAMTEASMADLARRLEQDDYDTAFAGLHDWHVLRAVAFQRPELAAQYMHLLDMESFDEE